MQGYLDSIWIRTRQLRIGFLTGLIVGALAGWFFHGLISFLIRFFFVIVLLIPFVIALIAWWRLRREVRRVRGARENGEDWSPYPVRPASRRRPGESVDGGTAITVDSWEGWDAAEPRRARSRAPDE